MTGPVLVIVVLLVVVVVAAIAVVLAGVVVLAPVVFDAGTVVVFDTGAVHTIVVFVTVLEGSAAIVWGIIEIGFIYIGVGAVVFVAFGWGTTGEIGITGAEVFVVGTPGDCGFGLSEVDPYPLFALAARTMPVIRPARAKTPNIPRMTGLQAGFSSATAAGGGVT